ncbi:hypothetical protein PSENEW3_00002933 [Picochlorum sp. SENEW3]|nr:hypothetical protein PSENEW3_00002933 [Picochlorum sp. SENEW3]
MFEGDSRRCLECVSTLLAWVGLPECVTNDLTGFLDELLVYIVAPQIPHHTCPTGSARLSSCADGCYLLLRRFYVVVSCGRPESLPVARLPSGIEYNKKTRPKGYLLVTCWLLAGYLPVTCRLLAGYLPVTCRLLAGYLSVTCRLLAGYLPVTCR